MKTEIEYLKERIAFLESLLDLNAESLTKSLNTNQLLIEEIKKRA